MDDAPHDALYWALAEPLPHLGFLGRMLGSADHPVPTLSLSLSLSLSLTLTLTRCSATR